MTMWGAREQNYSDDLDQMCHQGGGVLPAFQLSAVMQQQCEKRELHATAALFPPFPFSGLPVLFAGRVRCCAKQLRSSCLQQQVGLLGIGCGSYWLPELLCAEAAVATRRCMRAAGSSEQLQPCRAFWASCAACPASAHCFL